MKTFSQVRGRYKSPEIDDLISAQLSKIDRFLGKEIGFSQAYLNASRDPGIRTGETSAGDFVADAILFEINELLKSVNMKADLAIINGGSIRKSLNKGSVKISDIMNMLPYSNKLVVLKVTGRKLLEILESSTCITPLALGGFPQVSGIEFSVNTAAAFEKAEKYPDSEFYAPKNPGARVSIKSVNSEPFSPDKVYTLATTTFIAQGGDSYAGLLDDEVQKTVQIFKNEPADAVLDYIEKKLSGKIGSEYQESAGRISIR